MWNSEWLLDSNAVDLNRSWHPVAPTQQVLDQIDMGYPTLLFRYNDFQLGLVQGIPMPDFPDTWLIQSAFFADINPKHKRLWLRNKDYHRTWVKACQERLYYACVIKYAHGSSIETAYGKNLLAKHPDLYRDISWFQTDDGLSYQRFEIVA